MSDYVIKVENLSKSYTIKHQQGERYTALRDVVSNGVKNVGNRLLGRINGHTDTGSEEFWALNDVSFEVKQGERVGIIGRNGAGKSTLLKILSRITEPTKGRVHIKGRVASLLEVGTGFHPELTGRENIYLNGAILGMSREEIRRKFDEIVTFAEIEKFLDTPVKRYSSGMYVRLAFAVAAHLEPEILVVDEVLAVGDAAFQKKCLGKMQDVSNEGRTVLFVSHNMIAIQRLCTKGIILNSGNLTRIDSIQLCIADYLDQTHDETVHPPRDLRSIWQNGDGRVRFVMFQVNSVQGTPLSSLTLGQEFEVIVLFEVKETIDELILGIAFHTQYDTPLFATHWNDFGSTYRLEAGMWTTSLRVTHNYLRDGKYTISLGAVASKQLLAHIPNVYQLTVEAVASSEDQYYDERIGHLFIPMRWVPPYRYVKASL